VSYLARWLIPAALLASGAAGAAAQTRAYLEVGAALPAGDFASIAQAGPLVAGGIARSVGRPGVELSVEVAYARSDHVHGNARSDVVSLTAWAGYTIRGLGSIEVMPLVGLGAVAHSRRSRDYPGLDSTRWGRAARLGLSVSAPTGGVRVSAAAGYLRGVGDFATGAYPTQLASVMLGVSIPLEL
jgi:hypothetical protein